MYNNVHLWLSVEVVALGARVIVDVWEETVGEDADRKLNLDARSKEGLETYTSRITYKAPPGLRRIGQFGDNCGLENIANGADWKSMLPRYANSAYSCLLVTQLHWRRTKREWDSVCFNCFDALHGPKGSAKSSLLPDSTNNYRRHARCGSTTNCYW